MGHSREELVRLLSVRTPERHLCPDALRSHDISGLDIDASIGQRLAGLERVSRACRATRRVTWTSSKDVPASRQARVASVMLSTRNSKTLAVAGDASDSTDVDTRVPELLGDARELARLIAQTHARGRLYGHANTSARAIKCAGSSLDLKVGQCPEGARKRIAGEVGIPERRPPCTRG